MSIKPIDFQIMIPRTMEAAKISNDEAQRNLSAQQQQVLTTQNKAENSMKQVYSRAQAQNARILDKQKENRNNNGKKKQKSNNTGDDNKKNVKDKLVSEIKTTTIDIKI